MTQAPGTINKVELSWDDALAGTFPQADTSARSAWRDAVAAVAAKAKVALPACNGRIDKAVQIVLAGDVIRMRDGRAMVGSQSDAGVHYVVNGACECPDADRAPEGWCKHRLAAAIDQRAYALASAQMQALDPAPAPQAPQAALPEAPVSITVKGTLGGQDVLVTLRGIDYAAVLARARAAAAELDQPTPAEALPQCPIHGVAMQQHRNATGSWYSHKVSDGSWCRGKAK